MQYGFFVPAITFVSHPSIHRAFFTPQVHHGFYTDYHNTTMRPELTKALLALLAEKPSLPVYVIGHSMGAALAILCALDLRVSRRASILMCLEVESCPNK